MEKKRRLNRAPNGILTNGTIIKIEHQESTSHPSIDPYYFEEFFTAIYNANINDHVMSEIFLYLPSRKVRCSCFVFTFNYFISFFLKAISRLLSNCYKSN